MLCAFCRDRVLNYSFKAIKSLEHNAEVKKKSIEELIDEMEPNRFSESTLQSMARNILSSWTKSGHLKGRRDKVRVQAKATPATVVKYTVEFIGITEAKNRLFGDVSVGLRIQG